MAVIPSTTTRGMSVVYHGRVEMSGIIWQRKKHLVAFVDSLTLYIYNILFTTRGYFNATLNTELTWICQIQLVQTLKFGYLFLLN